MISQGLFRMIKIFAVALILTNGFMNNAKCSDKSEQSCKTQLDENFKAHASQILEEFAYSSQKSSLEKAFNGLIPFYAITATRIQDNGEPLFLDEIVTIFASVKLISGYNKRQIYQILSDKLNEIKLQYVAKFLKLYESCKTKQKTISDMRAEMDPFVAMHMDFMMANIKNFAMPKDLMNDSIDMRAEIERIFEQRRVALLSQFNTISCNCKNIENDWKFCIFNEMFFSKTIPISSEYVMNIIHNSFHKDWNYTIMP